MGHIIYQFVMFMVGELVFVRVYFWDILSWFWADPDWTVTLSLKLSDIKLPPLAPGLRH